MAVTVPQLNTAAGGDTFTILFTRFNQVANLMSTQVITTAANTVGGATTGNAQVSGIFSATVLATPTLRGGNVASSGVLNVSSNVVVTTGSDFRVGNSTVSTYANATNLVVNNASIANLAVATITLGSSVAVGGYVDTYLTGATTNTSTTVIDSWAFGTYRSAEYYPQVKDGAGANYQVSKLLMITDGNDAFMTEYAIITTNNSCGVWTVSTNSTSAILSFTGVAANNTIKGVRKVVVV